MLTITAVIPAKNEEKNIARCIKSVQWCNHVIVMSMGTDKTAEIAKKMEAEVVEKNKSEKDDFVAVQENINWAIDHAKTDWVLRIDADEEVTPELQKQISNILNSPTDIVAYGIPRRQFFWGGFLTGGDWAYDRLIRFFKKGAARYEPVVHVHEQFKVKGPIGYLSAPLNHYSHPTLQDARDKFQKYTTMEVQDMHDSTFKTYFSLITQPPYIFLRWIIWHKGYKDGLRGVIAGGYRAWYEVLRYTKYLSYKKSR